MNPNTVVTANDGYTYEIGNVIPLFDESLKIVGYEPIDKTKALAEPDEDWTSEDHEVRRAALGMTVLEYYGSSTYFEDFAEGE